MSFNVPHACGIQSITSAACVHTGDAIQIAAPRYNWLNANKTTSTHNSIYTTPSHNWFDRQMQFNTLNQLGNWFRTGLTTCTKQCTHDWHYIMGIHYDTKI